MHDRAGRELHVERADVQRALNGDGTESVRLGKQFFEAELAAGFAPKPMAHFEHLGIVQLEVLILPMADAGDQQCGLGEPTLPGQAGLGHDHVRRPRAQSPGDVLDGTMHVLDALGRRFHDQGTHRFGSSRGSQSE